MKTTRELLELAAKAVGWRWSIADVCWYDDRNGTYTTNWHPDTDDGDGARLETALGLDVTWYDDEDCVVVVREGKRGAKELYSDHNGDKQAARRMATLRAAVMVGEKME